MAKTATELSSQICWHKSLDWKIKFNNSFQGKKNSIIKHHDYEPISINSIINSATNKKCHTSKTNHEHYNLKNGHCSFTSKCIWSPVWPGENDAVQFWRERPNIRLHIYQKFTFKRHHHPVLYPGIFALLYLFTVDKSEVI